MKNKYLLLFLLGFTISSNAQVCSKDIILTARDYRECAIDTLYLNGEFHKSLELSLQNIILYPKDTDYILETNLIFLRYLEMLYEHMQL